jgi:hypothetical protein
MGDAYQPRAQTYLAWSPHCGREKSLMGIIAQRDVSLAAEPEKVHKKSC